MTDADEGRGHVQAAAAVRALEATLCAAGTALWLAASWVLLAVAGWGVADSTDPLTWTEWIVIILFFTVPPAALSVLGTMSWTGRRADRRQLTIAAVLAGACGAYAVWWLVQAR